MVLRPRLIAASLALATAACASGPRDAPVRQPIEAMRAATLARLFAREPDAAERVRTAAGVAVLGGEGKALVRDNATGVDAVLSVAGAAGEAHVVLVFTERLALHRFQSRGLDGLATAPVEQAAAAEAWIGAVDLAPGVKLYRLDGASPPVLAARKP